MSVVIAPPRRDQFFDKSGQPTLRFIKWIESLNDSANTSTSIISDIQDDTAGMQALKNKRAIAKIQEPEQLQKPRVKTENIDECYQRPRAKQLESYEGIEAQLLAKISQLEARIKNLENEI